MTYTGKEGQSIYDVCLQTYGTLNQLFKLILDNNISDTNERYFAGKIFTFDESLIFDNFLFQNNQADNIIYSTIKNILPAEIGHSALATDESVLLQTDGGVQIIID